MRKNIRQLAFVDADSRLRLLALVLILSIPLAAKTKAHVRAHQEPADKILIVKSSRTMTLMSGERILKTYKVALGTEPVGAKQKHGDHKTPEGNYVIDAKNAHSQFHLSLHISYPNAADRQRSRKLGLSPGGDIMIHGLMPQYAWMGAQHRETDWTDGCVAVTNSEIEEIWKLVPIGTKVEIKP